MAEASRKEESGTEKVERIGHARAGLPRAMIQLESTPSGAGNPWRV